MTEQRTKQYIILNVVRVRVLFSMDSIRSLRVSFLFELFVPFVFVWFQSLIFQP